MPRTSNPTTGSPPNISPASLPLISRLGLVIKTYLPLGFTSFGGPGVHVVILRKKFVDKLKWVDERTFLDLFALGNALPGPGSTQLAFSIAVVRLGVLPGLIAFLCWSLPGALGMAGLAAGISTIPENLPGLVLALLSGLNAAAVGLIALAAVQLGTSSATDGITLLLVWGSASFGICYHAPWMYPVLIAVGGAATLGWDFRRVWVLAPAKRVWRGFKGDQAAQGGEGFDNGNNFETQGGAGHEVELRNLQGSSPSASAHPTSSLHSESDRSLHHVQSQDVTTVSETRQNPFPSPPQSPSSKPSPLPDDPPYQTLNRSSTAATSFTHRRPSPAPVAVTANSASGVVDPERSVPALSAQLSSPEHSSVLQVVSIRSAFMLIAGFALLLIIPLAARGGLIHAGKTVPRELDFFANMILAGTIIFGGGPVVIPLLRDYVVAPGWVSSRDFLLIFAILQAFPGPNFNFAVALGLLATRSSTSTLSSPTTTHPTLGAFLGFIGIFSPGILLKLGLLPFYSSWRDKTYVRATIRGLNAAASGLVFTAVWQLFLVGYVYTSASGGGAQGGGQTISGPLTMDPFWAVVASGSFIACWKFKVPPWASIVLGGLAGLAWYGVRAA